MKRNLDRSKVVIKKRNGTRQGRGFSLGEIKEAGLVPSRAISLGLSVDRRRKSTHTHNIEALKSALG